MIVIIHTSTVLMARQINPRPRKRIAASSGWTRSPISKATASSTPIVRPIPTSQLRLGRILPKPVVRRHPPDLRRLAAPSPARPAAEKSSSSPTRFADIPPATLNGLAVAAGWPADPPEGMIQANKARAVPPERNAFQTSSCRNWPLPSSAPRSQRKMAMNRKTTAPGISTGSASQ